MFWRITTSSIIVAHRSTVKYHFSTIKPYNSHLWLTDHPRARNCLTVLNFFFLVEANFEARAHFEYIWLNVNVVWKLFCFHKNMVYELLIILYQHFLFFIGCIPNEIVTVARLFNRFLTWGLITLLLQLKVHIYFDIEMILPCVFSNT